MRVFVKSLIHRTLGERASGMVDYYVRPQLRRSWGGPFNGQQYRTRIYRDLIRTIGFSTIVETGTFRGTTTTLLAQAGIPVYTVEAHPRYFTYARLRLRHYRHVNLSRGDSRSFLKRLADDPMFPRSRVLFYLDAHWEDDLPLRDELEIIYGHWSEAVVMIDDFEVPGTGYTYDDYGAGKALTLDYLRPLAHLHLTAFFPAAGSEQETGMQRGCVVLCQEPQIVSALSQIETLTRHA